MKSRETGMEACVRLDYATGIVPLFRFGSKGMQLNETAAIRVACIR